MKIMIFFLLFLSINIYSEINFDNYCVEAKPRRDLEFRINRTERYTKNYDRLVDIIEFSLIKHFVYALIKLENSLNKITNINGLPATEIKTALSNLLSRVKKSSNNKYKIKIVWMWDEQVISKDRTYPLSDFVIYNMPNAKIGNKDCHGNVGWDDISDASAEIHIKNAYVDFTYLASTQTEECRDGTKVPYKYICYHSKAPNINSTNVAGAGSGNWFFTEIKKFSIESALLHEFIHCALKESSSPNLSDPVYGRYRDEATIEDIMLKIYPANNKGANFYEYTYNTNIHEYLFGGYKVPGINLIHKTHRFEFGYKDSIGLIRLFNPPNDLKYSKYVNDPKFDYLNPGPRPYRRIPGYPVFTDEFWCDDASDKKMERYIIPYKTCCGGF